MKYIKTFESFDQAYSPELNEGLLSWAKDIYDNVMDKFNAWRDKKAKEAATKLAVLMEEKSSDPAVQSKLKEIQKQYAALSPDDKKIFLSLANEKTADKIGKELDKAGGMQELVKESLSEELEGLSLNEALVTESAKRIIGIIMMVVGGTIAVATIIYACVVFCTLIGGFVAAWALGAGLSAGVFAVISCGVIVASGAVAMTGDLMKQSADEAK